MIADSCSCFDHNTTMFHPQLRQNRGSRFARHSNDMRFTGTTVAMVDFVLASRAHKTHVFSFSSEICITCIVDVDFVDKLVPLHCPMVYHFAPTPDAMPTARLICAVRTLALFHLSFSRQHCQKSSSTSQCHTLERPYVRLLAPRSVSATRTP